MASDWLKNVLIRGIVTRQKVERSMNQGEKQTLKNKQNRETHWLAPASKPVSFECVTLSTVIFSSNSPLADTASYHCGRGTGEGSHS